MGFFVAHGEGDMNLENKDIVCRVVVRGDVVRGDVVRGVVVHGGLHIGFHAFLQNILCLIYDLPFLEK